MTPLYPQAPILVVDDEEAILLSIDTVLQMAGMKNVITCSEALKVMGLVERHRPSLVLLDLNMPDLNGEALIERLTASHPRIPIVVITGRIDADTAVECLKSGAYDYIVKPVEEERLLTAVKKGLQCTSHHQPDDGASRGQRLAQTAPFSDIVTVSPALYAIFEYIESIATTAQPLLIRGETGTGKELIARATHANSGRTGAFIAVNVAGLDETVLADTLFGHCRGAFTGADADRPGLIDRAAGGTLFLDEIGDLTPASQIKLLRLLQENEYLPLGSDTFKYSSARIITSTHVDLWAKQRQGLFREDLHYRLRTHRLRIPPLRKRKEDLPPLVDHFLEAAARSLKKSRPKVPVELITLLGTYDFPGNIRELQAMIFDAMAQHKNGILSLAVFREHLALMHRLREGQAPAANPSDQPFSATTTLPSIKQATWMLIEEAMLRANNNQSIAASLLGISQQALSKRLKSQPRGDD
ncbi:MAG: sigma-54-dependent transcriptional regulator [Desulfopila sp.]